MYHKDEKLKKTNIREVLHEVWHLSSPYWRSREWKFAAFVTLFIVVLTFGILYLFYLLNLWQVQFYNSFQNKDFGEFVDSLWKFVVLVIIFIPAVSIDSYVTSYFTFRWRKWMTEKYVTRWLGNDRYYKMMLKEHTTDNPDQRISVDINEFTTFTFGLFIGFLKEILNLILFIGILYTVAGPLVWNVWGDYTITLHGYIAHGLLIYAIIGTYIAHMVGNKLVGLRYNQEKYEADFRYRLVRFRERREEIAFYDDIKFEEKGFIGAFWDIRMNYLMLIKRTFYFTLWEVFYINATTLIPYILVSKEFFFGTMTFGVVRQVAHAFNRVESSISYFIKHYESLSKWRAVTRRLYIFDQEMEQVDSQGFYDGKTDEIERNIIDKSKLLIQDLTLYTPKMKKVLDNINFEINQGDKVLIKGPSGIGKSTLLRVLSGIWPFGEGTVSLPDPEKVMFVPQKPYMPIGTLREVVCYSTGSTAYPDEEIAHVFDAVGLGHLKDQLNVEQEWIAALSLGEQQRVIFARIILAKPDWVIMDEPTASMDKENEKNVYQILAKELPDATIITVGHSETLQDYHDRTMEVKQWKPVSQEG